MEFSPLDSPSSSCTAEEIFCAVLATFVVEATCHLFLVGAAFGAELTVCFPLFCFESSTRGLEDCICLVSSRIAVVSRLTSWDEAGATVKLQV